VDGVLIFFTLLISLHVMERGSLNKLYLLAALVTIFVFYFFAPLFNLYRSWRDTSFWSGLNTLIKVWLLTVFTVVCLGFITKTSAQYSRMVVGFWFILAPFALSLWRFVLLSVLYNIRQRGRNSRTAVIAGADDNRGAHVGKIILNNPSLGIRLLGFYDDLKPQGYKPLLGHSAQVLGVLDDIYPDVRDGKIDRVYIALPFKAVEKTRKLVYQLADTAANVFLVPDFLAFDLLQAHWLSLKGVPMISVYDSPYSGIESWIKRVEDIVLSSLILLVAGIPMLAIALGVKLSSPGPVIFKQPRYGMSGEEIIVWKFRTMTVCEDGTDECVQATKEDARLTRFGAFLRKYSLDELPQFINVLQGRMTIVGPRPHAIAHNEYYRKRIPGYMLRHKAKPGITGYAQINGWRGETNTLEKMEKRVEYDLEYMRNWSLWLDLKIIFLTIFKGVKGENAY
jgi:putative colanic acid biosysnthesis UDP-glucose lipid carrier transferase